MRRTLAALFLLVALLCLSGLARAASDQEEVDLGRRITPSFERDVRMCRNTDEVSRLQGIVDKLAPGTGRSLPYRVQIVEADDVNAITFPGGFIYVYRGLLDLHPNDDQMAGVLGHEMAHAVFSHGFHKLQEMAAFNRLKERLEHSRYPQLAGGADLGKILVVNGVGRHNEDQADYYGVKYAAKAGYDPRGLLQVLQVFARLQKQRPGLVQKMFATHPPPQDRIIKVRAELHEMGVQI